MSKTEETSLRSNWMPLETLCECLSLDEAGVERRLEAGQIERLHRAGKLLYRVRVPAEDASDTTTKQADRDQSWREALAAFKSRRHGRFLSRKRSADAASQSEISPIEDAEVSISATEPELQTWSRFPGYFSPDFNPEETPA